MSANIREQLGGRGGSIIAAEWAPLAGKGNNQRRRRRGKSRKEGKEGADRVREGGEHNERTDGGRGKEGLKREKERERERERSQQQFALPEEVDVAATQEETNTRPTDRGGQLSTSEIIIRRVARKAPRQNKSKCDPRRREREGVSALLPTESVAVTTKETRSPNCKFYARRERASEFL